MSYFYLVSIGKPSTLCAGQVTSQEMLLVILDIMIPLVTEIREGLNSFCPAVSVSLN